MNKRKNLALLLFTILACVCLCVGMSGVFATEKWSDVSYDESYKIGDELIVQKAEVEYGGNKYSADGIIILPGGKKIAKNSIVLTEGGIHTVEYRAVAGDKLFVKKFELNVRGNAYSVVGNGEVNYGTNAYLEDFGNPKGLNVSLENGAEFKFNKVINVTDLKCDTPLIKWYSTPNVKGKHEVNNVVVKLTDVYDPENYITVLYKYSFINSEFYTYITAGANGLPQSGIERKSSPETSTVEYKGNYYVNYVNSRWYGLLAYTSFTGVAFPDAWMGATFEDNYMWLSMDYAEKTLHCQPKKNTYSAGGYEKTIAESIITDLDEEVFFGDKRWHGFTTGEVVLSLYATQYETSAYNFFITEICGYDISDATAVNNIAPMITVNTAGFNETALPDAITGNYYKIFDASAIDDTEGSVECITFVYYNYNNSSRSLVQVVDGRFKPEREGKYSIVYVAADSYGNKSQKVLTVNAKKRDGLVYSFGEHPTEGDAGEVIGIAKAVIDNANPEHTVKIQAILENPDVVYDISNDRLEFRPLYAGKYEIRYLYKDYSSEETFSYSINVKETSANKFIDPIVLPRYIINNCEYNFDDVYAYGFSGGTKRIKADCFIRENGGAEQAYKGNYEAKSDVKSVEVIYRAGSAQSVTNIPVINVGYGEKGKLNLAAYLQGEAFTAEAQKYGTYYSTSPAKADGGAAKLSVVNRAYLIDDFSISFGCVSEKNNFGGIRVIFTDLYSPEKKIVFTFAKNADLTAALKIEKEGRLFAEAASSSRFETSENNNFAITLDKGTFIFGGCDLKIPSDVLFGNFNKTFYIDFELFGITGESSVFMCKVVNQPITSMQADTVKPTLIYEYINPLLKINDVVSFKNITCYDFVDANAKTTLIVTEGVNYAVAADGTKLDGIENDTDKEYLFKCENYNNLSVIMKAVDYSGLNSSAELTLVIKDLVPPTITIKDGAVKTCSVGATVKLAEYTATDNLGKATVTIAVISPDGSVTIVKDGKFTANEKGTYTIMYMVSDDAANFEFESYTVKCK